MRRVPATAVVLAAALGAVALAACGSSAPGITEKASRSLELQVAAVRNAAAAVDREGAEQALADLVQSVNDLRSRDRITADRAEEVLDAAATVRAQLLTIPTTTTTTTTTTTLPPPPPPPPVEEDDDRGKGRGGEDENKGGGNGGDGGPGNSGDGGGD